MSIYSPSRNRILVVTLILSLLLHLAILEIISANSYSTGKNFSLSGGNGKIRISLKTYFSINNTKGKKKKSTKKQEISKIMKEKNGKKQKCKKNKSYKAKLVTNEKLEEKAEQTGKENVEKTTQFEENHIQKKQQIQKINTKAESKNTGGGLFSFFDWKRLYINAVISRLEKNKKYPMAAREMGIQGTVKLTLTIDRNGNLLKVTVAESSGFSILDKNAVETAKKAKFPPFPPEVKKDRIEIPVYVIYKLAKTKENMQN